jgi:Protein of unknown function DUF72
MSVIKKRYVTSFSFKYWKFLINVLHIKSTTLEVRSNNELIVVVRKVKAKKMFEAFSRNYKYIIKYITYLQYYIGCSGWSYSAWQGQFYPANIDKSSDWLCYYASVFDYVEIDSSFYKSPNLFTVKNWFKKLQRVSDLQLNYPKLLPIKEEGVVKGRGDRKKGINLVIASANNH